MEDHTYVAASEPGTVALSHEPTRTCRWPKGSYGPFGLAQRGSLTRLNEIPSFAIA